MANISDCPAPFLDSTPFGNPTGYVEGRFCGAVGTVQCCLPCPTYKWLFPDSFLNTSRYLQYTSPFSLAACVFLLASWICLPPEKSHRQYLSVGLICCVALIALGLTLPLIRPIHDCADAITPADGVSDPMCGVTGAFFLVGALGVVVWIFLRVIWLHISVCWNRTPGPSVMYLSISFGVAIPLIFLAITLRYSGFTFNLGPTCFIYHEHSFVAFWGWMIGFTCASFVLQLITSIYCVTVFVMSHRLRLGSLSTGHSSRTFTSFKGQAGSKAEQKWLARQLFNRRRERWKGIQRILLLQWRIIALTVALLIQCLYFGSLSWVSEAKGRRAATDPKAIAFGACLFTSQGDREKCLPLANDLMVDKKAILASLGVMALSGAQALLFLSRLSMFTGWWYLLRNPLSIYRRKGSHSTHRTNRSSALISNNSAGNRFSKNLEGQPDSAGLIFPFRTSDMHDPFLSSPSHSRHTSKEIKDEESLAPKDRDTPDMSVINGHPMPPPPAQLSQHTRIGSIPNLIPTLPTTEPRPYIPISEQQTPIQLPPSLQAGKRPNQQPPSAQTNPSPSAQAPDPQSHPSQNDIPQRPELPTEQPPSPSTTPPPIPAKSPKRASEKQRTSPSRPPRPPSLFGSLFRLSTISSPPRSPSLPVNLSSPQNNPSTPQKDLDTLQQTPQKKKTPQTQQTEEETTTQGITTPNTGPRHFGGGLGSHPVDIGDLFGAGASSARRSEEGQRRKTDADVKRSKGGKGKERELG